MGDILEMRLFRLKVAGLILESLKKFEQNLLGDLAPSSFQVGEPCQAEIGIQIMSSGIEGPAKLLRHRTIRTPKFSQMTS